MISFEECMREGLLRRMPPSKKEAEDQLQKAAVLLDEAKAALAANLPNSAMMTAYTSVLDAGRALLFRDGYREKSHACVGRYLEAKYSREIGKTDIYLFDEYRDRRHKTLYSGDYYPTITEAKRVVSFAQGFIEKVRALLKP
ncbi:MAG: HEPN domain-containing protein [Candidatus Micrarchaeota archaeon]